jgi:hypothetical protein
MRRTAVSLALALCLSGLGAASALAEVTEGARKVAIHTDELAASPCGPVFGTSARGVGFAVLNTPGDDTTYTGEVVLRGAAPNSSYEIVADQTGGCLGGLEGIGGEFLTTNSKGNGKASFSVQRQPWATTFYVEVDQFVTAPSELLASSPVELD